MPDEKPLREVVRYTRKFKFKACELADQIGVKQAAKQSGCGSDQLRNWMRQRMRDSWQSESDVPVEHYAGVPIVEPPPVVRKSSPITEPQEQPVLLPPGTLDAMNPTADTSFCLPALNSVYPPFVITLLRSWAHKVNVLFEWGISDIYKARNALADRFLKGNAEWSFWLDSDMFAPVGDAALFRLLMPDIQEYDVDALSRMKGHGKTFVGGLYFGRKHGVGGVNSESQRRIAAGEPDFPKSRVDTKAELIPVDWVGAGCWLVHRKVFEDVKEKFPQLAPTQEGEPWGFFTGEPGQTGGEDIAFARRAKEAGHQTFLDPGVRCLHFGQSAF